MTLDEFLNGILDPGLVFVATLDPEILPTPDVRRFLLTVAQQESGPKLDARYQGSPSNSPGPARGWWQFEQSGGVAGVMQHAASKEQVMLACRVLHIHFQSAAIWRALEGHDTLSVCFARMLLRTDTHPVPTNAADGWKCYADRLWRPGKPHPETWQGNWDAAAAAVQVNP